MSIELRKGLEISCYRDIWSRGLVWLGEELRIGSDFAGVRQAEWDRVFGGRDVSRYRERVTGRPSCKVRSTNAVGGKKEK
jgi:hypothetical protein